MKRNRFTEEQIIGILKEQEAGAKATDLCRQHGISSATFYKWKTKYGGLDVSEARRLRALEEENANLLREVEARKQHIKRLTSDPATQVLELRKMGYVGQGDTSFNVGGQKINTAADGQSSSNTSGSASH